MALSTALFPIKSPRIGSRHIGHRLSYPPIFLMQSSQKLCPQLLSKCPFCILSPFALFHIGSPDSSLLSVVYWYSFRQ
ncbi:hypothetical protein CAEBREN_25246 [Caenorhabditis brenneri]|uniref:Uncharacterized protein n=1 Tax=Caenorhabditis brenneri TaxID=135651 RepID=G0ND00_CAEBE|nr:hypothetical protein CAEBREN_25246 [Caenorhabditis brenneri]